MKIVLILDDDDAVRESFVNFFEDRNWRVLPARTAEEALEVLQSEAPDGAIVDIRLPGMDGAMFIREVSGTHPTLACVLCTGSPEYRPPDDVAEAPQVYAKVIAKPVAEMIELEKALRLQIEKCRGGEINHD